MTGQLIESFLKGRDPKKLRKAALELSQMYRSGDFHLFDEEHRYAYLLTRFPATFAALSKVFEQMPPVSITSMLDCGAGPGTGWLAASQFFPLEKGTCIEHDLSFLQIGQKLLDRHVAWERKDLADLERFDPHDLVLFSYSLGEVKKEEQIIKKAWEATKKALVVIEPGTPQRFGVIRRLRQALIGMGAVIWAPCPHHEVCPMPENDWCHFSVRLPRSSAHRIAKGGELGYEDEKFSYLIACKGLNRTEETGLRVLRHPIQRKGHRIFTVCSKEGLREMTTSKRNKDFYKKSNKKEWGDLL